jgi:hypothetical protein
MFWGLYLDVGIRTSSDNSRIWETLAMIFLKKIDDFILTEEDRLGSDGIIDTN